MSDGLVVLGERRPLAPFTTLGIGGEARWFARIESLEALAAAHEWASKHGVEPLVLGGGSNLVVADLGWPGVVLHVAIPGVAVSSDGLDTLVTAGAGEVWDDVVAMTVARGLAGLECLSGVPGTVGGTPIQNVGAYGQEVADVIDLVKAWDRQSSSWTELDASECRFGYRTSRFKSRDAGRFVVGQVRFRLRSGPPTVAYPDLKAHLAARGVTAPDLASVRESVLAVRRKKGMVLDAHDPDTRSVGSFFSNPVVDESLQRKVQLGYGETVPSYPAGAGLVKIPAAWLIERAGFPRGYVDDTVGGVVGVSTKHPLALINRGGATAQAVVNLAGRIKQCVLERFGVWLQPEPVFVGFGADAGIADLLRRPER